MRSLRRNWKSIVGVFGLIAVSSLFWWGSGTAPVASADPVEYTVPSPAERSAILTVAEAIHLDRDALIALNVTGEQAVTILGGVRTWYDENKTTLTTRQTAVAHDRAAVRQIEKAIRLGPQDPEHESALATARQALATAQAAQAQLLASLKTTIDEALSESQRTTWAAIEHGFGRRMPIRMLAMTAGQRTDYGEALRRYRLQLTLARSTAERETATTAWQTAVASILTQDQEDLLAAYASYAPDAAAAVAEAYETVLPSE